MPQIIVIADTPSEGGDAQVMFRERVSKRDFESGHFATQLAERLGWAVGDAHAVDHRDQLKRIEAATEAAVGRPVATSDEDVSAETPQRRSARVVTTAS
jgi:hypothetical protein